MLKPSFDSASSGSGRRLRNTLGAVLVAAVALTIVTGAQVTVPFPNFVVGTVAQPSEVNANFSALSNQSLNRTGGTMTGTLTSQTIAPSVDATYTLGDGAHRYTTGSFSGTITAGTFSGALSGDGSAVTNINAANIATNTLATARGGTALNGSAAANGALLIGNGAGYTLATLTAGTGATITNGAGSITVGISQLLDKSTTQQDVNTTTTETSVYSFSIPANTLGTNKTLRLTVTGSYLNNSGGADNFTPRVKFGGTTIASSAPSLGAGVDRRTMKFVTEINANGATNSQRAATIWTVGAGAPEAQFDGAVSLTVAGYHGSLAVDTTASQTITLTVQHGTSAGTISFRRFVAMLEILQ